MKVTWATIACFVWFGIMVAAFVVALALAWRKRFKGMVRGLGAFLGGLLSGALVAAIIGLYEVPGYVATSGFWLSLIIGALGLFLFCSGVGEIARPEPKKIDRSRAPLVGGAKSN